MAYEGSRRGAVFTVVLAAIQRLTSIVTDEAACAEVFMYVIRADGSDLREVIGLGDFKRGPVWVSG